MSVYAYDGSLVRNQLPYYRRLTDLAETYADPRSYAKKCLPSTQQQAALLEQLRHKWRYHDDDTRGMQLLGDVMGGRDRPTCCGSPWRGVW